MIISKKVDGCMKDRDNLKSFLKANNIEIDNLVTGNQVHGKRVAVVGDIDRGDVFNRVDGFITKSKNIVIGVYISDCLPISFRSDNVCGILHVGWRSLFEGIIEESMNIIGSFDISYKDLNFEIGPGIKECHFEVKDDFLKEFEKLKEIKNLNKYIIKRGGKTFFRLEELARDKILEYGVENIKISPICTFCDDNSFSFRRDKKIKSMFAFEKL